MKARAELKFHIKERVELSTVLLHIDACPSHQGQDPTGSVVSEARY